MSGSMLSLLSTACAWLSWPECHWRGMCVGHGLLSSAIFADHCSAYSGRRSQPCCFWGCVKEDLEVTVQNDMLWCVEGQRRKLSYYQPPLVKAKAGFHKKYSSCPREEGLYEKPWSLSEEDHATEMVVPESKASPWCHEISVWKDSDCIFQWLKYNFIIQWWWRTEKKISVTFNRKWKKQYHAWSVIELSPVSINAWERENMEQKY